MTETAERDRAAAVLSGGRRVLRAGRLVVVAGWHAVVAVARFLHRWRAPLVLVPLVGGLVAAGGVGASMLWAHLPDRAAAGAVTCWDGAQRSAGACSQPHGLPGLR